MACSADATRSVAGGAGHPIKLAEVVAEEAERHPGAPVEVLATDEHRLGLKPVLRRVWAPGGERPIARGHHRFEWLYVTAFVSPGDRRELLVPLHRRRQGALRDGCSPPSPARPAPGATGSSSSSSTAPAGTPSRARRARRHPPRLPAALHPGAAARREPLAARRRAHRQPPLRHARRARRRRRRTMPSSATTETSSPPTPTSTGGQRRPPRCDHPNLV